MLIDGRRSGVGGASGDGGPGWGSSRQWCLQYRTVGKALLQEVVVLVVVVVVVVIVMLHPL